MGGFDRTKAYAPQGDVLLDDGREVQLLHYVYARPDVDELRGSPARVLAAVDEFARTRKYLMNVGEHKGAVVTGLIGETRPQIIAREPLPFPSFPLFLSPPPHLPFPSLLSFSFSPSPPRPPPAPILMWRRG